MKKNDFLCLNSIIYIIYNEPDFLSLRRRVLELVQTLIPCAFASFMTARPGPGGPLLSDPVCRPEDMPVEQAYQEMQQQDYSRWLMYGDRCTVVRASDLLPEEERVQTLYYRTCFAPFGLHYAVDAALIRQGGALGVLSLYRGKEAGDFTADEVFLLQALAEHLAARFAREAGRQEQAAEWEQSPAGQQTEISRRFRLTRREAQVLAALLQGDDTAQISRELCISPHTLKKHQQSIYRKCGVGSRAALAALCRDLER
ncbi:MAG: GAF domain-containing protein [Firmicutes bacterium]|nr:GAF domain-containing protein [Bacillota bacterium]